MNILLINHYAGSPEYGMEYRPYYLAREWIKNGHNVRIVAASESHVRRKHPVLNGKVSFENIDNIDYVWVKTLSYQGNGFKRVLNMLSFVSSLFFRAKTVLGDFKPDVVIASSTYPLDIYPARHFARKFGAKLVFELHDLWPLSPIELGNISPKHPFMLLLQYAENFYCKKADKVISILPNVKEHLMKHGMSSDKLVLVPNGIVLKDWENALPLTNDEINPLVQLRQKYNLIVGYAGAHGVANALSYLVDTAEILKNEKIAFVLVGSGHEKDNLKKYAQNKNLDNVLFLNPIDKRKIPSLLENMDILYIGLKKQPLFRFGVSPNKLFDYMMAAKPIVHAIDAGNDLVAQSGCGISCEAENSEAIAKAILKLKAMSVEERQEMGLKGRNYVIHNHDYGVLANIFLDGIMGNHKYYGQP